MEQEVLLAIGPALPLALLAGQTLVGLIRNSFRPEQKFTRINTSGLRRASNAAQTAGNAATLSNIRAQGASRKLSAGAISSNLAGANKRLNIPDVGTERTILGAQRFNAGQDFRESQAQQQDFDQTSSLIGGAGGGLSKILLLWKAGLLDLPDLNETGG